MIYLVGRWAEPALGVPSCRRGAGRLGERLAAAGDVLVLRARRGRGGRASSRRPWRKLPVALPFALATIVGGIDCTESAAAAGDEYDTRAVLLTEGGRVAGGGAARRRHPDDALHRPPGLQEDGRAGGLHAGDGPVHRRRRLLRRLPVPVRLPAPGGDVPDPRLRRPGDHRRSRSTPRRSCTTRPSPWPCCRRWRTWRWWSSRASAVPVPTATRAGCVLQTLRCLANGFLITSVLWAAALAMILDGRLRAAAGYFLVAAACALRRHHALAAGRRAHRPAVARPRPSVRCQLPAVPCSTRRRTTGRRRTR